MEFTSFKAKFASLKPGADILQRWHERMVPPGWDKLGRLGAGNYLAQYGKGLGVKKAVALARAAELAGSPGAAGRFFEEAYFLETGIRHVSEDDGGGAAAASLPQLGLASPFVQSPQLLTVLDEAAAMRLVDDPEWGVQEKVDGERLLVRAHDAGTEGGNKRGLVRYVPAEIAVPMSWAANVLVDGELVTYPGLEYHLFDLLRASSVDLRQSPFAIRYAKLAEYHESLSPALRNYLKLVPLHVSLEDKRRAVAELRQRHAEGFVLKRLSAAYGPGEAHGDQFKFQFRSTSAFVVGAATDGRRSVQLFANRADGSRRDYGRVTIPTKHPLPTPEAVVEVEYLYCHPGADGKLAQPVFKGVRTDALPEDCREDKVRVRTCSPTGDGHLSDPRLGLPTLAS